MILELKYFDECANEPAKPWLIKGVMAADEDSSWFGPPGSLKSMLLTDIAVHLAAGIDWRGYKTKAAAGVVYFALERAGLTRRRLAAYAMRDKLANLPIAVAADIVDLTDDVVVLTITETIKAAEAKFGITVGLIVFDTYSKGIAAGSGDEDKAQHANIVAANLKKIHEAFAHKFHVATIGHTGKDESRGERGSNAKLGHVDLAVQISDDRVKTATVTKGNDQPDGVLTVFGAEEIIVGTDEDGEPRTAGVVSTHVFASIAPTAKRSARQDLALNALDRVIRDEAAAPPPGADIPMWVKVVTVDRWRDELFRCGVLSREAKNPWQPFKRLRDDLAKANLIVERDGHVWPSQPGGIVLPSFPSSPSIVPCLPPY
jgi:AAA domain